MKTLLIPALLATWIAGSTMPAHASVMVQLSTNQMVDASDSIVRGKILEVWTEEDERGVVWTRAQLEVTQVLKGDKNRKKYIIDQMGGTFGGNQSIVQGRTHFSTGEEGIFFLENLKSGRTITVGLNQGKFTLRLDPYSRQTIVQRYSPPQGKAYDHRFIPLPSKTEEIVTLDDLVDSIETRLSTGWDGKAIPGTSLERLTRINGLEVTR